MQVWLVWTGEYSDKNVEGVYSSEDLANRRGMEVHASWVECATVDETPPKPDTKVWWQAVLRRCEWSLLNTRERLDVHFLCESNTSEMVVRPTGKLSSYEERDTVNDVRVFVDTQKRATWAGVGFGPHEGQRWEMFTNIEAPTREAAAKIATERFQREFAWWAGMNKPLERSP